MGQPIESRRFDEKKVSRREFLARSTALSAIPAVASQEKGSQEKHPRNTERRQPNVLMIIADQVRWDMIGAYGLNPMHLTPNIDGIAQRGVRFLSAITNQPLCAPSRACLMTGQYPPRNGVFANLSHGISPNAVTIATAFRQAGYTTNYIGKWHLALESHEKISSMGPVPREQRGGFLDFWEASNIMEYTTRPYEGTIYDSNGKEIKYSGVYRVDFLTQRAVSFLQTHAREPFLLVVSYLEPHFQNDWVHPYNFRFVAPKGYAEKFSNPFVPHDLKFFPGTWQKDLPDYYGCVARVDEGVGTILETLKRAGLEENTIVAFLSDHGCHFNTRNVEYKRSPHESSIHIPLVVQGPGLNRSLAISQLVSQIDVAPTLLEAAGVPVPETMQGRSAYGLLGGRVEGWRNEMFIMISESMVGRAIRTDQWTYAVVAPDAKPRSEFSSDHYVEYQLYDLFADPHQLVNLAGRREYQQVASHLRGRLKARMAEAEDQMAEIEPAKFYP